MAPQPVSLLARALDSRLEPPDDPLSERILDAALSLSAAVGLRHMTMDEVARRARVGRMTVYRRFGDKARLVDALAVRESRRCIAELDAAVAPDSPITEQVAQGMIVGLRIAREHPLLNRLARLEPESVLDAFAAEGGGLFATARAFVAARIRAAQGAGVLGSVPVDESAELFVRICLSFVLIQESVLPLDDEERVREFAARLVAPVIIASGARPGS